MVLYIFKTKVYNSVVVVHKVVLFSNIKFSWDLNLFNNSRTNWMIWGSYVRLISSFSTFKAILICNPTDYLSWLILLKLSKQNTTSLEFLHHILLVSVLYVRINIWRQYIIFSISITLHTRMKKDVQELNLGIWHCNLFKVMLQ